MKRTPGKKFRISDFGFRIILLCVLCVYVPVLAGCDSDVLRFAPSQQQRQNAQMTAELAGAAHQQGLPPGSEATRRLAAGAAADAIYAGPPQAPVDASYLTPPAITGAWVNKDRQVDALRLKEQLKDKAGAIHSRQLADLVESMQGTVKIKTAEVIRRVQAYAETAQAINEAADSIVVPGDLQLSDEEMARMRELDKAIAKITSAAAANAAARPTSSDIADEAVRQADRWGTFLADAFPWLAALPGVGGVLYGVKRIKTARDAQKERDEAQVQAAAAAGQANQAQTALGAVVRQNDAFLTSVAGQAQIEVAGQKVAVAELFKTILRGQDPGTAALVNAVRTSPPSAIEPAASEAKTS